MWNNLLPKSPWSQLHHTTNHPCVLYFNYHTSHIVHKTSVNSKHSARFILRRIPPWFFESKLHMLSSTVQQLGPPLILPTVHTTCVLDCLTIKHILRYNTINHILASTLSCSNLHIFNSRTVERHLKKRKRKKTIQTLPHPCHLEYPVNNFHLVNGFKILIHIS